MKSWIAFILTGFLLISFTSAISINEQKISDIIVPELNIPAIFDLEINNVIEGEYNLYTLTDVEIQPEERFTITESDNVVRISVFPRESLNEKGYYIFSYNLNNESNINFQDKLTVRIMNLEEIIEIDSEIVELDSDKIRFYVQNKENVDLGKLKAKFSSVFFNIEKEFELGPNEKREIVVDADKDKMKKTKAGTYIIKGEFETNDGKEVVEGNLNFGEKKEIATDEDTSGLLIRTKTITKINTGNVDEVVSISVKKNIFSRLFTSFNNEPDKIERNDFTITYSWSQEIGPSEIFTIKAKTNYILPVLIIALAVLIVWFFKRYSEKKVEVKKSVSHVKTKDGKFALKVRLSIKAKKSVENVSVIDRIPSIVRVYENFGIVKPDKIDSTNRRLQWNLGDLKAGEERVFNYVVYSKVGIVGKFSLPEALAVFKKEGSIHEERSNKVFFMSAQVKRD